MGDTGILAGLVGYFVILSTFLAMHGDLEFTWSPPSGLPGKNANSTEEQGFISNALECGIFSAGAIGFFTGTGGLIGFTGTGSDVVKITKAACSRQTVTVSYQGIDAFFQGLSTAVDAIFVAFRFMASALQLFWDLITLNIPGPPLLNVFLVWVPLSSMAFLIFRQIRGVG